jgi:[DsrC]-trisulfide reductase subunit M
MNAAGIFFALLFYAAALLFVAGLAWRIWDYVRTPVPLKIPTTPAPTTGAGVVLRMLREVTLFESLFKANLWIWLFGWMFHVSLALVLAQHLRYFTQPVWTWVVWVQPFGVYAGFTMVGGLAALWGRRLVVERIRYVSAFSDHLMLALLLGIGISGLSMKYIDHTDIINLKEFALGLIYFDWQPLPAFFLLYVHLFLVALLLAIFPYSKLLHVPGVFFSPSRNQADNTREQRYVTPWAVELNKAKS